MHWKVRGCALIKQHTTTTPLKHNKHHQGLIYAMDYLAANFDWLAERMAPLEAEGRYFMFDTPGQASVAGSCLEGGGLFV
jgi:hypothetical protein